MKKSLLSLTLAISSILIGGIIALATSSAFAQNTDTEVAAEQTMVQARNGFKPLGMMHEEHEEIRMQVQERTASKLGVTVEEMDTARTEARSEVFTENGIDLEALKEERLAHMTERFQELVDEGRITQEEMDERLQAVEDDVLPGPGGFGHGHRGPRPF